MTHTKDEALDLAQKALIYWQGEDASHTEQHAAYHAIKQARSAPVQEPKQSPPFTFRRFVAGSERAQDVAVHREVTLEAAVRVAAKICPPSDHPTVLVYTPPAQPAPVQEPVAWTGCGECDCSFPCHGGRTACIRNVESECASPSMTSGERTEYEARIKRLGEALTLQYESGERLAARIMELEEATPPAQPTPANLWMYWKVDDKSVITGPFKTPSKDEAYGLDCIDQTQLTVPAAQPAPTVQEPVIQRVMSRLADLLDEDQFKEIEGMVVVAGCTPPTQPAAPVPLTDEQKLMCWSKATHDADVEHKTEHQCLMDYGSEIEAAHGITEKGNT